MRRVPRSALASSSMAFAARITSCADLVSGRQVRRLCEFCFNAVELCGVINALNSSYAQAWWAENRQEYEPEIVELVDTQLPDISNSTFVPPILSTTPSRHSAFFARWNYEENFRLWPFVSA